MYRVTLRKHMCGRHVILLAVFFAPVPKSRKSHENIAREFIKACQDLRWTRYEHTSSFRNQRNPRKSCSTSNRGNNNSDGSKWLSREWCVHGKCYLLCRNVHDKMAGDRTAYEEGLSVKFDGQPQTISSKDESRVHHFANKCFFNR